MRDRVARNLDWLADHPWITAALLALLAAGGAAIHALVHGIPAPGGADEYSYLLAADTFASGRLANPAHPFWQHFETFHVLQQPTYVSKYPPGQGLVLALGQAFFGHPITGVWLSIGLMVAVMYWMFRAWLPARWALLGGMLVVLQLGVSSYWAQSYWGGAVAAAGGALVFGATRRVAEKPTLSGAVALGMGLAILANSRPFEGLVVSLFAALALAWLFLRGDGEYRVSFMARVAFPVVLILAFTGVLMGAYNLRTTGDVFRMPYQVYADTYSMGSFLPWKEADLSLEYRHEIMREFELDWGRERLKTLRDPVSFAVLGVTRTLHRAFFFLGPFAILLLVGLPRVLRAGWMKYSVMTVLLVWLLSLFTTAYPHYVAPAAGLLFVISIEAARRLADRPEGTSFGAILVGVAIILELALFGTSLSTPQYLTTRASPVKEAFAESRSAVIAFLDSAPAPDLVLISYGPGHSYHREWAYNEADIDASGIVWARDMGESGRLDLLSHFPDRRVWALTVTGGKPGSTEPYRERILLAPYTEPRSERPGPVAPRREFD